VPVALCEADGVLEGLSDQARRVVELASGEARALGHSYVGPEHLLLGLCAGAGETAAGLQSAGVDASAARAAIEWILGTGIPVPAEHPISLADRAQRVLVRTLGLARDAGSSSAGTDHLLLAVLIEPCGIAARMCEDRGVALAGMREDVIARVAGVDPRSAERYRTLVQAMREAQAADSPHVVDPFADEPPDLVDGLLEPDRRVLAALGTRYSVSRRIVGGDPLLYARLARMAQDWVCRYPLVQGRGNFGSIDGWPAADMEFTEARLSNLAPDANMFPLLLANGAPGIPPHNLAEVIATTVAYIVDPTISTSRLIGHLRGPDFPTGGAVLNGDALPAIYETGSGTILLRGRAHTEPGSRGQQLVITELPYGVTKGGEGGLIDQIAERVRQGTLEGILDLVEDSDRTGMRILLELTHGTDPDAILGALYEQTDLQISHPVRLAARVEGEPRTLTLRDLIAEWVTTRLLDQSQDTLCQQLLAVVERHHDARRTVIS
jgi:hypothetical protein